MCFSYWRLDIAVLFRVYITEVLKCKSFVSLVANMDAKTSIRIIIIPMLLFLFLFLSATMVIAEPSNVVPPEVSRFIIYECALARALCCR